MTHFLGDIEGWKNEQLQKQKRNAGVPPLRFASVGMTDFLGDVEGWKNKQLQKADANASLG
jgi:hypothetical protein